MPPHKSRGSGAAPPAAGPSPAAVGAPNLEELVGTELAERLVRAAGGLLALSRCTDGALRHLGADAVGSSGRARQLHCGHLIDAPVFVQFFDDDEISAADLPAARKSLSLLGKKCVLAARLDASGGSADGRFGEEEREKLKAAFARCIAAGKVGVVDTQALAVPEVHLRGADAAAAKRKRRGGVKEFKKREAQREEPTAVQRALSRVKMGVSAEEQQRERLQSNELWVAVAKEQEKLVQRETRKRGREADSAAADEYGDLLNIVL